MTFTDNLRELQRLTDALATGPSNPTLLLARARIYQSMGYDDLAAADAYYVLTLVETALDPDFSDLKPEYLVDGNVVPWPRTNDLLILKTESLSLLRSSLTELECLQDACTYHLQLRNLVDSKPHIAWGVDAIALICKYHQLRPNATRLKSFDQLLQIRKTLPNRGLAHREVYPWNVHEPIRISSVSLAEINDKLQAAAPNLEARATELPVLRSLVNTNAPVTDVQLGLFASADLAPSSTILQERSIITAIRPIDASFCDLCASPLPELTSSTPPVACPDCSITVFCSKACLDFALTMYHKPPFCNNDDGIDEIGRNANAPYPADDLYFLLVARTIAMAEAQDVHPLDLFETKYLCGEFTKHSDDHYESWIGSRQSLEYHDSCDKRAEEVQRSKALPFSFMHNILLPFRFFTTLMLSDASLTPYSSKWIERYDHWIIQTLFAKFRGVASARQSTWDAKPEVAAVHPLWCLANHSCNPNVRWQWGGSTQESEIRYTVQEKLVWQNPAKEVVEYTGIKKDEEIMNHYVDIDLSVQERRDYAMGPLGGECRCERCVWEAKEMTEKMKKSVERSNGTLVTEMPVRGSSPGRP